ncbi:hypothetical protein H0H92_006151 [Tricholoma furcatifolium]|nr:hypothetical protein H0H92_006151 [Tricholoma furcatifolium]
MAKPTDDADPHMPEKPEGFRAVAANRVPGDDAAEHLLKLTKVGRPFHKDTADLFATFVVATELKPHRLFFRSYPRSFSTDEAMQSLSKLKFSQSTRTTDPDEPTSFITTTTNFVFSMTIPVAMELCQHFMDARYIRNALDPSLNLFKDRGLHSLTPKGLHVLERFIEKTGIDADHLQHVFEQEIICPRLFNVDRGVDEDNILFPYNGIIALFQWFVGQQPNYATKSSANLTPLQQYSKQSKGISLVSITDRSGPFSSKTVYQQCFDAVDALEWLCDFTSVCGRDEAAEVAAHFERLGLIALVGTDKWKNHAIIFTVYGAPEDLDYDMTTRTQGEFRCVNKAYYQVTDKGRRIAGWDSNLKAPQDTTSERASDDSTLNDDEKTEASKTRVTSTDRLHYILKEQSYRSLFRAFLQEKFCEEHILYWLDVDAINRKFNVTSSAAIAGGASDNSSTAGTQVKADRRKHHQALLRKAVQIYKSYLHPTSDFELNTNYTLRNELFRFLDSIPLTQGVQGAQAASGTEAQRSARIMSCNGEQLQTLMTHFNVVQAHTFRVMLTDSLPPFMQTEKFTALQQQLGNINLRISGADTPLLPGAGGAFISYSYLVN